jgi:uncharacterized membrane protein YhaH (DUF805 family)
MQRYSSVISNYATFSGRAHRTEFWMFTLVNFIVAILIGVVDGAMGTVGILGVVYGVLLLPTAAGWARRLHDIGRTGWWQLLAFAGIGMIKLLLFALLNSQQGPNTWGQSSQPA